MQNNEIINAVATAKLLGIFKSFCESNNDTVSRNKIRNIISISKDKKNSVREIIKREQKEDLNDSEAERMLELITAFLNKKTNREPVAKELKEKLLVSQKYKCAICGVKINVSSHADHIVPFKYVGDCLKDNLQLLCEHCNKAKNASLDYQIRYLLKL